jgi:enterochelin esterase-like enzyme
VGTIAVLAASISLLPGFSPVAAGPSGGAVLVGTFPGTVRPGFVYLPPRFDPSRRYPVVYLLHGMPGSPSQYLLGCRLASFADAGISAGRLQPFIVVAPAAGPDRHYNGEWAGPLEGALVDQIVPWVDAHLPTVSRRSGRVIAGLSAGGYGAVDIGLRNPGVFESIASWSGYFKPLRDGPFKHASPAVLAANTPTLLVRVRAAELARDGTRFFVSSGPAHNHWFKPADSWRFARELRSLDLPVVTFAHWSKWGDWRTQMDAGLEWAFGTGAVA